MYVTSKSCSISCKPTQAYAHIKTNNRKYQVYNDTLSIFGASYICSIQNTLMFDTLTVPIYIQFEIRKVPQLLLKFCVVTPTSLSLFEQSLVS